MARYVDGYVMVTKKKDLKAYRKLAAMAGKIWKKYGALQYVECAGDDMFSKLVALPFPKLMRAKAGEVVLFSFVVYKSRAHRDAVNAKVMKDPKMSAQNWKDTSMPFDMKRVASGGFKTLVDL